MCRIGCPEQGAHVSWGECLRAARIAVKDLSGTTRMFEAETQNYRKAVADGLDPVAPTNKAVAQTYAQADKGIF